MLTCDDDPSGEGVHVVQQSSDYTMHNDGQAPHRHSGAPTKVPVDNQQVVGSAVAPVHVVVD